MSEAWRAVAVVLALALGAAACSEEDPVAASDLQTDLEKLREQITEADSSAERYGGGLLGEIAATRREVLLLSAALLENKLIAEQGGTPTEVVARVSKPDAARAEQLLRHIAAAEEELEKIEDAAGQRDGMAGSLSQTAIATQELTIAQLRQAYFEAAYGLALPEQRTAGAATAPAEEPPLSTSAPPVEATEVTPATGTAEADVSSNAESETADSGTSEQIAATPPPEAPAAPRTFDRGDYQRIQSLLKQFGFDPGPLDGQWGPKTSRALTAFQRSAGLPPSGEPDPASLDALGFD
jgi:hypothetical protein